MSHGVSGALRVRPFLRATLGASVLVGGFPFALTLATPWERGLAAAGAVVWVAFATTRLLRSGLVLDDEGFVPRTGAKQVKWSEVTSVVCTGATYWMGLRDGRLEPVEWQGLGDGAEGADLIIERTRHARRMVDTIHIERWRDGTVFGVGMAIALLGLRLYAERPFGDAAILSGSIALVYGAVVNGAWLLAWRRLLTTHVREVDDTGAS